MSPFHRCPRCGYQDHYEPERCRGCGLQGYGSTTRPYVQIEARVFEEMRYEIKDLKIRVDGQTRPYQEATTKKTMTLKDKFALAFKGEPEKTFIKAGVMGIDGTLTAEGRELWTTWLVKKFGDDFKKEVVDPILAETAADKKD